MNEVAVSCETGPGLSGYKGLTARAVVLTAGKIEENGLKCFPVFGATGPEMRALVFSEFDLTEARGWSPVPFLNAGGEEMAIA